MRFMNGNGIADAWGLITSVRPVKRVASMLRSGASFEMIQNTLRQEFGVSDSKISLALSIAEQELLLAKTIAPKDIAIYIDIPFCPTKCAYCSFASVSAETMKDFAEPYLAALYRELEAGGKIVKDLGFTVRSVYIGGGTPTTLMALELDNLLYKISKTFDISQATEFTVEAGRPDTITPEKLAVMHKRGVTRISINPQSIHAETLRRIGRKHSPEAVFKAVSDARKFDFSVINMDVIAGLPGETCEDFQETLEAVAACHPENLTIHTMSIKRASRLREEAFVPTEDQHRETVHMLDFAYDFMQKNGYQAYYLYRQKNMVGGQENTGFCLPGKHCLYNIGMMEELMPVFGFGVGAVTKLVRPGRIERIFNVKDVAEYLRRQEEMCRRKEYVYTFYENNV